MNKEIIERVKQIKAAADVWGKDMMPPAGSQFTACIITQCEGFEKDVDELTKLENDKKDALKRLDNITQGIYKCNESIQSRLHYLNNAYSNLENMYAGFKNAQRAQKQATEANKPTEQPKKEPVQKKFVIAIDTSWPLSPREIQQAIDVLKSFKPESEDGLGMKSAAEALESFKKVVEKAVEKNTTVKQEGLIFKLSTAE